MFYEILEKRCKEINTTPTKIIKEINISLGNIEKWKNGTLPNGKILIKLAEKLNCSVDYLLGLKDTP